MSVGHLPELETKKGTDECVHLQDDYTCAIYEDRPVICRIDDFPLVDLTKEEWYQANAEACNRLIERHGRPSRFMVVV